MSDKLPRIIGIGASAGGLEALEQLFGAIPNGTGMAYVVIQHLSPDFKSLMTELLSRRTKMDIRRVDSEELIEGDHVYLIPPKKLLEIRGNKIVTIDFDHTSSPPRAVDHFFQSLAREMGSNSVGIVLSGTGSDGTIGSSAIRDVGEIVIAQDPDTCKFDGMPSSVIRKGLAQETLSPDEIAQYILGLSGVNSTDNLESSSFLVEKKHIFYEILAELEDLEGIDFKNYRMTTLARRIERRMQAAKFATIEDYFEHFKNDPLERAELQAEFLIGVTRFFRDEEAFDALRNSVIPEIILRNEGQPIRVWVVGCSTGEEAVSLGILLYEATSVSAKPIDFKIFATDVDRRAIEFASIGKYSANQIADLPRTYKDKYFTAASDSFEIKPSIRRNIIYSHHNLLKDPPFTKIDLLSCRNLLIYFQNSLQDRCLNLFHFALKPGGVLFLGRSEALGEIHTEFDTINTVQKIFKKRGVSAFSSLMQGMKMAQPNLHTFAQRNSGRNLLTGSASVVRESQIGRVYDQLLNTFVPPCLLMDDKDQLIHVFGSASQLLKIPSGKTTLDVMKLLPHEIALALRSASTLATSNNQEVVLENIEWLENEVKKSMTLRVKPLEWNEARSPATLMVFFDLSPQPDSSLAHETNALAQHASPGENGPNSQGGQGLLRYHWNEKTQEHIQSLENHLKSTRENLQTAIEELETTNEELQSTNEELMSSNEELPLNTRTKLTSFPGQILTLIFS